MKNSLSTKTGLFLAAMPLVLAGCNGQKATSSAQSSALSSEASSSGYASVTSPTGFSALKAGLNADVAHDNIGLDYVRPSAHQGKVTDDFALTYTPAEQAASSSASSSSALASSSSTPFGLDLAVPVRIGLASFSDQASSAHCYLNGLTDSIGDQVLNYFNIDSPIVSFKQGGSTPTRESEEGFTSYLSLDTFYLDLSKISSPIVSTLNSAVQAIPGNESWEFPEGQRGKVALPSKLNSFLTYFTPLSQYLPEIVSLGVETLQEDTADQNLLGTRFESDGTSFKMSQSIPSFRAFYTVLVNAVKKGINSKTLNTKYSAEAAWTLINDSILKPIKKYGDCLSAFSWASTLAYSAAGTTSLSFDFTLTADLSLLESAYASSSVSGFVTAVEGAGTLMPVVGSAAQIPTPSPALSTYPDIPAITYKAA